MSYLGHLTFRLAAGASQLPAEFRARHAAWLAAQQRHDGGFAGRKGASDLYYTGFGIRALGVLGELSETQAAQAAAFLESRLGDSLPPVDFFSLVQTAVLLEAAFGIDVFASAKQDRRQATIALVDSLRTPDGAFAKMPGSTRTSVYHTFLSLACLELVDAPIEMPDRTAQALLGHRCADGGFVEMRPLQHSGTNPTAAAAAALKILGAMDEPLASQIAQFLALMQTVEGGFRANTKIPVADLLSTFSAQAALAELGGQVSLDTASLRRYIQSLEQPQGGFRGGVWDDQPDVEYTFYGVASRALV